nr:MAG: capsid protein [Wenzhou bat dicistrovirus 6]
MIKWSFELRNSLASFQNNSSIVDGNIETKIEQDVQEIVTFVDEGVIPASNALPSLTDISKGYLDTVVSEDRTHSIIDFLSRPIIISSGTWLNTNARGFQLYTANFPEALISNVMYQEKLKGFVGLRATLCVRVQVNSQPFQQGRLMLQYFPYAQYMANRATMVNYTLTGRSGCPRTDLDLSVGTEIDLCIPYVSPHLYYNLITGQGSFGSIYLVVYSPLLDSTTATGVEYTVWAHLENIVLQYPTGAPIYTGSTPNKFTLIDKISSAISIDSIKKIIKDYNIFSPDTIYAQSELEFLQEHAAPSAGFGQIAEGLNTLSYIPIIGNLFTRPAWITAKIGNLLRLFGFSKPTITGIISEMRNRTSPRMANFDGSDTSHKLSLASDNAIETAPGLAGTDIDEMAINRIISIPNFWNNFSWSNTATAGTVLWQENITPYLIRPYSATVDNRFICTHLGYLAQCFGLWRGSIVYTFKFVKTKFHSGRVLISFIPFYYVESTTITPDVAKCYKMVVDLRTSTEVTFTVPYVSSRPWMFSASLKDTYITDNYWNSSTGSIRIQVLNELRSVSTVSSSIDVLVEINAGPDFSFANPSIPKYVPSFFAVARTEDSVQVSDNKENLDVKPRKPLTTIASENLPVEVGVPFNPASWVGTKSFPLIEDPDIFSPENFLKKNKEVTTVDFEPSHYNYSSTLKKYNLTPQQASSILTYYDSIHNDSDDNTIEPQGVGTNESIPRNESQVGRFPASIDHNVISANWSPEAFCIGEKIFSIRQLLKRFYRASTSVTLDNPSNSIAAIIPHMPSRPMTSVTSARIFGYYDLFYYIFAFYRGSMRIKLDPSQSTTTGERFNANPTVTHVARIYCSFSTPFETLLTALAATNTWINSVTMGTLDENCPGEIVVKPNQEGLIEFEVPYYNVSHITQCSFSSNVPRITSGNILRGAEPPLLCTVYPRQGVSNTVGTDYFKVRYRPYRAVGDDFSFLYLVGVPLLTLAISN